MVSRFIALEIACVCGLAAIADSARAEGIQFPGTRPLGTGGAMRAFATGDAGPMLNPSGISLIRTYQVEGAYQYGNLRDSNDARFSAVDSTSGLNIGGALFYQYHHDSQAGLSQTGQLGGGSLSFPIADKIFLGGSAKYLHFIDAAGALKTGFNFDAGLTIRPMPQFSIGAVAYNLRDLGITWAPKAYGGGVAIMPMPALIFVFDIVAQDVPGHDSAVYYMGGGEFSFSTSAALRAGGGSDGLSKNGYITAGLSGISASIGSLDVGFRQDVSGATKSTIVGVSARLFVPSM